MKLLVLVELLILASLDSLMKRAKEHLIYDFMPNGPLDKFIFNQGPSSSGV